jgi:acetyl esterase/lipase
MRSRFLFAAAAALALAPAALAQPSANFTRTEDVIYGRKFGTALTMDVFTPKEKANGKGIIWCVSGGWVSAKPAGVGLAKEFVDRGYVVFAVVHGSQPKFSIPEVLDDMHRAVRFIKANAKRYNVDPDALGISGGSAGGHLSLMLGVAPAVVDPKETDPVNKLSSQVAAVACFYPPTDFLNYGKEGESGLGEGPLKSLKAPFDFHEYDKPSNLFVPVTDAAKRREIGKAISPVYHIKKDSAPALIVHGDADAVVPIQQAELVIAKYKEVGVPCELVVKKGAGHGWKGLDQDVKTLADWFDKYLLEKK